MGCAPSSKGRESTTITENRFPSSCAFKIIFSTTEDLKACLKIEVYTYTEIIITNLA